MANRSMDVAEQDGQVIFLRKLREGPAAESYGLHVAALAGLPENVLRRAGEIMASFSEQKQKAPPAFSAGACAAASSSAGPENRSSLSPQAAKILKELASLKTDAITPIEALNVIHRWKNESLAARSENRGKDKAAPVSGKSQNHPAQSDGEPSLFD